MANITDDELNEVGEVADSIDNLLGALQLPLPDALHVKALKGNLPGLSKRLKAVVVKISGSNPWEV